MLSLKLLVGTVSNWYRVWNRKSMEILPGWLNSSQMNPKIHFFIVSRSEVVGNGTLNKKEYLGPIYSQGMCLRSNLRPFFEVTSIFFFGSFE